MNSLQLPPVTGVQSPGPSSSGTAAGVESSTAHAPPQAPPPPPQPRSGNGPPAPTAEQVAAAVAARAGDVARAETPSFNFQVGLIGGSFKVFVDVADTASHRVIARVYGPRGQIAEPAPVRHFLAKV